MRLSNVAGQIAYDLEELCSDYGEPWSRSHLKSPGCSYLCLCRHRRHRSCGQSGLRTQH